MGRLKFIAILSVVLITAMIFIGQYTFIQKREALMYSQHNKEVDETSMEAEIFPYIEVKNAILAENGVILKNGENVIIKLHMPEGHYFDEENAGCLGMAMGEHNYVGGANWEVYKGDVMIFSAPIESDYANNEIIINRHKFEIIFADYNEDGNPDFSFGQYGSSSINLFTLYTILEDGTIELLSEPYSIVSSENIHIQDYSILFSSKDKVINTQFYNNTAAKMQPVSYIWSDEQELFIKNNIE